MWLVARLHCDLLRWRAHPVRLQQLHAERGQDLRPRLGQAPQAGQQRPPRGEQGSLLRAAQLKASLRAASYSPCSHLSHAACFPLLRALTS